jgi:threonine dehydrogenase-like Zn-dependent dehydrogenase
MQASQIEAPGKVRFIEAPEPEPGTGQVVIRTALLAVCGSDIHQVYYDNPSAYPKAVGSSGHEMVGYVHKIGPGVSGLKEGDATLTLGPRHNAMSTFYLADRGDVYKLPSEKSMEELLMAQQLGTVIYACKRLPNMIGRTAVIVGQGSAGLFFNAYLKRLGVEKIIVMDIVDARVRAAKGFGASDAFNNAKEDPIEKISELTGGAMADLVVEAAGEEETINLVPNLVREKGILYFFGVPRSRTFRFDFTAFYRRYAQTYTSGAAMNQKDKDFFDTALKLIAEGEIDVKGMLTHRFPFSELPKAYDIAKTREDGVIKALITMPDSE